MENLADQLAAVHAAARAARCFIGFDGFVDEIIHLVDQRSDAQTYTRIPTITAFAERVGSAAHRSANVELVPVQTKIGGNAPIMTQALLEAGHAITFAGAIGLPGAIEPLFAPIEQRCANIIPLGPSGHSDALEFQDGKIILGKLQQLNEVTAERLLERLPLDQLIEHLNEAELVATVNWTMLPGMTEIWRLLAEKVAPQLTTAPRWLFIDLADPAKRSDADLSEALALLSKMPSTFQVVLGLNKSESVRLLRLVGASEEGELQENAGRLRDAFKLAQVVIHTSREVAVATLDEVATVDVPHCEHPKLSTGAGDHFNAGYCHGLLSGFVGSDALAVAIATAGFYIRQGCSPAPSDLVEFLRNWTCDAVRDRVKS